MNKNRDKKKNAFKTGDIHIDYDHLDVEDIMNQIKKKIEARPKEKSADNLSSQSVQQSSSLSPPEFEESLPPPSRARKLGLKLMKPFSPLIKFLVLPVHHELRETVHILDRANKRLDSLRDELEKVKLTLTQLDRIKEYIKLLHHLSHNTVEEMTKMKIEEENLRMRIRILEKDFEHLKNRERVLESQIVQ